MSIATIVVGQRLMQVPLIIQPDLYATFTQFPQFRAFTAGLLAWQGLEDVVSSGPSIASTATPGIVLAPWRVR
jgi:hypothetical protein